MSEVRPEEPRDQDNDGSRVVSVTLGLAGRGQSEDLFARFGQADGVVDLEPVGDEDFD